MERLKQVMLQHELIFRNQVCELHRLYWIQKNLMNELRIEGTDSDAPGSYSWRRKESEEKKNAFSIFFRAKENSVARNVGALEEFKDQSTDLLRNQQREFSLHHSAVDFIRSNGEDPAFYHQAGSFRCEEVIDLESSVELEFHKLINDQVFSGGFRVPLQNSAGVFGTQASVPCALVSSSIVGNDESQMASVIHLSDENGGLLQEQKSSLSCALIDEPCIDASVNRSRKRQQAWPPMPFDLNLPHEDERSVDLNGMLEQEEGRPAETSSVPNLSIYLISHGKDSKFDRSIDSKLVHNTTDDKNDTVSGYQIEAESCEGFRDSAGQGFVSVNASSISSMNLHKQAKDDADISTDKLRSSSHSDIKRQDSNITSSNSINLPQTVNKDSATKPTNHEGSEEDTSSSHSIAHDEISPSFLGMSGNTQSSNTDDSVTTQLNSSQNEGLLIGRSKPGEEDTAIVSAAEALMCMTLGCSSIPIQQPENINTRDLLPQCSSDSFECLTLQLSEVQSKDCRLMIEPSNLNEAGRNERGARPRRGRGFKDFQKEILPGLVTLSRHEICEDLHNIGYNLGRARSRRNARDNWFVPVRSRRSRPCSGRQRRSISP